LPTAVDALHRKIVGALRSRDANELSSALRDVRAADIAEVLDLLEDEERSRLLYSLAPRLMAEVVVLLDEAVRGEVVEDMAGDKLTELVSELPPDDAADVVGELPDEQTDEVLDRISREQSEQIAELLAYEEASAGGLMNPRLLSLGEHDTVGEAINKVRAFAADEDIHYVYVVDDDTRLVGLVTLRRLVVNRTDTRLADICDRDPVVVRVDDDQEDVLRVIKKYDVAAVPVIDAGGRLLGRITYDDVMDVAAEEADEDIFRMAGTDAAELETHSSVRAARVRMAWLMPCIFGTLMAGAVIALFEESALGGAKFTALLMFVPMIAATSGNTGIQASTIVLRGFATGEPIANRFRPVIHRELRIAILIGVMCAIATGIISGSYFGILCAFDTKVATNSDLSSWVVGSAVGLGMLCAIAEAATLGILLPFLFRRIGVDPAIASGPLITSANDLLSVSVYLAIAYAIII
jgi:magnesium transporter